jgi:hypothetical protein
MPRRTAISSILIAAAALAGCTTTAERERERELRAEFGEVAGNCALPRHALTIDTKARRIQLAFLHRSNIRIQAEQNGSLGCARHWAQERGYRLVTSPDEEPAN